MKVLTTHKWMHDPTFRWGGFLFKCMQCGHHEVVNTGRTASDAYRKLPHGAVECEPNLDIILEFGLTNIKPFQPEAS